MRRQWLIRMVVLATMGAGVAAGAESASVLLEKGIHLEQTVGDLDAAIKVYEQIVADEQANRRHVAQARFRLGNCHLKKGNKGKAKEIFEKLIAEFPDQKELVAQARKHVGGGLELGPVCWDDGEVLQLDLKLQTGLDIGTFVVMADSAKVDRRDVWRFQVRRYIISGQSQGASRVDVNKETFRPISSVFKHEILGNVEAIYGPDQVETITRIKGKKDKKKATDLDDVAYDNEQGMHLFRRLPLAVGYKVEVPIFAGFGAGYIDLALEVPAKEKLKVPAGEFECYRLELNIGQTFWISTDPKRYLVKFEGAGAIAELAEIRHRKPGEPSRLVDKKSGISLTAPSGWFFYKERSDDDKADTVVHLLDPEAEAFSRLVVKPLDKLSEEEKKSPRAWAEKEAEGAAKVLKDLKVRDESWKELKVAGRPAVGCISDYVDGKRKMMSYNVYVLGPTTGAEFCMMIERDDFDEVRKAFDAIIASYKAK